MNFRSTCKLQSIATRNKKQHEGKDHGLDYDFFS